MTSRAKMTLALLTWAILMATTYAFEEGYLQFCTNDCNWESPND